jgi:hypothetical protein
MFFFSKIFYVLFDLLLALSFTSYFLFYSTFISSSFSNIISSLFASLLLLIQVILLFSSLLQIPQPSLPPFLVFSCSAFPCSFPFFSFLLGRIHTSLPKISVSTFFAQRLALFLASSYLILALLLSSFARLSIFLFFTSLSTNTCCVSMGNTGIPIQFCTTRIIAKMEMTKTYRLFKCKYVTLFV